MAWTVAATPLSRITRGLTVALSAQGIDRALAPLFEPLNERGAEMQPVESEPYDKSAKGPHE